MMCRNPHSLQTLRISGDTQRAKEEKTNVPMPEVAPRAPCAAADDVVEMRRWKYSDYCKSPRGRLQALLSEGLLEVMHRGCYARAVWRAPRRGGRSSGADGKLAARRIAVEASALLG
jgi:hypothetical protein